MHIAKKSNVHWRKYSAEDTGVFFDIFLEYIFYSPLWSAGSFSCLTIFLSLLLISSPGSFWPKAIVDAAEE